MDIIQPVIEVGTLRLRDFTTADVELVNSASNDLLIPLTTSVPSTPGEAEARDYIARQNSRLPSGVGYSFAIARTCDDLAVGYIGLTYVEHGRASIGYWIGPDHRGQGYAALALRALGEWALTGLSLPRLELYVEPWNEASGRTALAAGFEREGLLRSWQVVGDTRRDMWMYSRVS
ncbi:GNAT family protein [Aeromicrobium sp.]|uniref:GNAT family N-acetyltransferase n=1 Tax=Aeromicrobium sp. TaxID=1871063 RepID=UPI0030C5327C